MKKILDMVALLRYTYNVSEQSGCEAFLIRVSQPLLATTR